MRSTLIAATSAWSRASILLPRGLAIRREADGLPSLPVEVGACPRLFESCSLTGFPRLDMLVKGGGGSELIGSG